MAHSGTRSRLAILAFAAAAAAFAACHGGLRLGAPLIVCSEGTWHGATAAVALSLSLHALPACENPPTSMQIQGSGILSQPAMGSETVAVTGNQQVTDLVLSLQVDTVIVGSFHGQFAREDSLTGVLSWNRGLGIEIDSGFVLVRQ
jgi:hypothetical protein